MVCHLKCLSVSPYLGRRCLCAPSIITLNDQSSMLVEPQHTSKLQCTGSYDQVPAAKSQS